jgi:predicted TIM-barrel fold metal-dependent hydrolase
MRIDVHAHHFAPEYVACVSRITGSPPPQPPAASLPLAERADLLKEAGVDLQVLSLGPTMPHFPNKGDAVTAARVANDAYAAITSQFAGRFAAFGALPLPHVEPAIAEAGRCLDELRMLGVTVGCSAGETPLDEPSFEPLWQELNHRQAVVFLHPIFRGADAFLRDFDLIGMVGACFEDTLAALRLALSGVTQRYPDMRVIVPHFGGTIPFLWARIQRRDKTELLRSFYWDTANGYGPALACACQTLGADRLMLGTDFPYITPLKLGVDYVRDAGLSPADAEMILDRTAARVLGLDS